jgi:hypothetical protein
MIMTTLQTRLSTLGAAALLGMGVLLLTQPALVDAAPVAQAAAPTDKEQCKKNGWQAFGDLFKNQADCVSFVNELGGGGLPVNPAATPELGSLVLFGSGAVGMAGYALHRLRLRRRG